MEIPKKNYIGILQEKCQAYYTTLPQYEDVSRDNRFEFTCTFNKLTTHGIGPSKKFAKQNAAKDMLEKIESENLLPAAAEEIKKGLVDSAVSKLNTYCLKEKIGLALYSEIPKENGLYCCQCSLKGYTVKGQGNSKKEAKEKSASLVVDHFKVNDYLANLKVQEPSVGNSIQELNQFCQKKRLCMPTFEDQEIKINNATNYKVTCSIGDLGAESSTAASKKAAKLEAASLMLQNLKNNTSQASPVEADQEVKKESSTTEYPDEIPLKKADQEVKKESSTTESPDEIPLKKAKTD